MELDAMVIARSNARLAILLPQYKNAILTEDLTFAKTLLVDIDPLLKVLGKKSQLSELKNSLFEIAINKEHYNYAIEGLTTNRRLLNKRTRLYLEATTLLAIAYIRKKDISSAKPYITEVLQNPHVIKSESTRRKFNEEIIKRFDEEAAFYSLRNDEIEAPDIKLLEVDVNAAALEDETKLLNKLGYIVPKETKDILFEVDQFSKKQLTYTEQKYLPPPESMIENEKVGQTVFTSFKRTIHSLLCDPNNKVYKNWNKNASGIVIDRSTLIGIISGALAANGIGYAMIVCAAALILKKGLDIYCEKYKPVGITELRRKK